MSNATFYNWRSKYRGVDASSMRRLKELEEENARLKKMYAEEKLKAEIIAASKKMVTPSRHKEMAKRAVAEHGLSIRFACKTFRVSETCYRYQPKLGR